MSLRGQRTERSAAKQNEEGRGTMIRKLSAALLAGGLVWLLALPALAAPEDTLETEIVRITQTDPTYSGPLDPLTGLPASTDQDERYYTLQEGNSSFDRETLRYVNTLGSSSFTSSIPNGAVVSKGQSVSFSLPAGMTGTLYSNGSALENPDLTNIVQEGSYLLEVRSSSSGDSLSFSFRILGEVTNALTELSLPSGFTFDYIRLNGEALTPEYANYLELLENGDYEIRWSCPDIAQSYTISFALDTQPPVLALPEVTDGQAYSEVTLTDLEKDAYILLEQDGQSSVIRSPDTVIRDAGTYRLTVYDQAGNSTVYEFTIHLYLNLSAFAAIGLLLAGLAALWGYSRYIRTHPRVG